MWQAALPEGITAAVTTWPDRAGPGELTHGPTAADLGGFDAVEPAARLLALSPWFVYLVDVAGHGPATPAPVIEAITEGFRDHERASSYASAAARLLRYPALVAQAKVPLEKALISKIESGSGPQADPRSAAMAATALETMVHLVTTSQVRPHRLLGLCADLAERVETTPLEFRRRAPRLIGLLHEWHPEEELVEILRKLADDQALDADATFELALLDLRTAFSRADLSGILDGLLNARRGFAAASEVSETRPDADAYAAAIDAVLAFNQPAPEEAADASARLNQALRRRAAWTSGCYTPPWMVHRTQEERAWGNLSVYLAAATPSLADDVWYHADEAISALVSAYRESRAITRWTARRNTTGGVEAAIRPAIESAFLDNSHSLSLLRKALACDERFQHDEDAQQLLEAITAASQSTRHPAPGGGGGDLGKDSSRVPTLRRYLKPESLDLILQAPPWLQRELETVLYDKKIARQEHGNPKVAALLDQIEAQLATSPDWPVGGAEFRVLVEETVLFAYRCFNIGSTTGGLRTSYLGTTTGEPVPKENRLQSDYLDWLKQGPYYATVRAEVPDVAAGRADVVIDLGRMSFYVECKREQDDASRQGLHKYLGQTRAYSVTNVALGLLLVLDLTSHPTGNPDLFSSVWVETVQVSSEETPRKIVVVRVPGMRPTPSATATPLPA
ncbi:hypothetical protein [Longispora albida]|uniref:hypothetical protein n=1 Tax=Longispora albida TaxID=203523 RepID=UPI000364B6D5|nr:hypothetical protein [Longispora albida]